MERYLYRFVSFFEIYELLIKSRLKVSRLSLMSDKNEGLGDVLKFQESIAYSRNIRKQEKFIEFHEGIKGRTYISSWTSEPDLMAMWLLYSQDSSAIRIKTTQEKLKKTLDDFWKSNYWTKHLDSKEGTIQIDDIATVDDVDCISFEEISNAIKEKYKKYYKIIEDNIRKSEAFLPSSEIQEHMQKKVIESSFGILLKDKAYSHEKEVRAFFSTCLRNKVTREEYKELILKDNISAIFGTATSYYPTPDKLPNIIKIPIAHDFIEGICFDPRMPTYKKDVYLDLFFPYLKAIEIEESFVFGYKPEKHKFSVDD